MQNALRRERPLSPHLSVYKFKYTLTTSILNRITGLALSLGLPLLAYWLTSLAAGEASYEEARAFFGHPLAKVLIAGLIFAFAYHLVAGIRHLVWDTGRGMEREQAYASSWITGLTALLIALGFSFWAFAGGRDTAASEEESPEPHEMTRERDGLPFEPEEEEESAQESDEWVQLGTSSS